jgi:hypothetical protein
MRGPRTADLADAKAILSGGTAQRKSSYIGGKRADSTPVKRLSDCVLSKRHHHLRMGKAPNRSSSPDLFSPSLGRERDTELASTTLKQETAAPSLPPQHVLPSNLDTAIKRLDDQELDRLFSVVVSERKRRGKNLPHSDDRRQKNKAPTPSLTSGQINAIRAAFKAGVTPSRIGRQFGFSQSSVRKALASVEPNR